MIHIIKVNAPVYSRNVGYEVSAVRVVDSNDLKGDPQSDAFQALLDKLQDKHGCIDCGGEDQSTYRIDDYDMPDLTESSAKKVAVTLNIVADRIVAFYKGEAT